VRIRSKKEVASVFNQLYGGVAPKGVSLTRARVIKDIMSCRTASLGGHISRCKGCGYQEQSYNSCWNRHCPKCQGGAAFQWTENRLSELLPTKYFHIVFTIPQELRELCYYNKKLFYQLLFEASSKTLLDVGLNNEEVKLGFFGTLHSWNQDLEYHPHIHYLAPAGGLTHEGKWQEFSRSQDNFFLPIGILRKVFRGKLIQAIKKAYKQNKFYLEKSLSHLKNPQEFERLISRATKKPWMVYAKRPFASPEIVVKYLSNYTHRVAISNYRILSVTPEEVRFSARHRIKKNKRRVVSLSPKAFAHRFLQHILPKGFRRVRYFGFLYNEGKASALEKIRQQLNFQPPVPEDPPTAKCPSCKASSFACIFVYKPHRNISNPLESSPKIFPICLSPP
jgi:predicted Zn-ribbon and HTH transcriptional regulator